MILASLLSWLPALLAGGEAPPIHRAGVRSMVVEQQLIIRVPVQPRPKLRVRWQEEKGPKCLPSFAIARAALSGPDRVDFILRNRQRVRARLDSDCSNGLDFYGDLYIQPEEKGRVCARRDVIRSRVGATCRIEKFHWLVPRVEKQAER
jgi:hypothetical protein